MTAPKRTRRIAYVSAIAIAVAAPTAALAASGPGGKMTAPTTAKVGQTITVHATDLKPAKGYNLVLSGGTAPSKNDYCIGVLGTSSKRSGSLTFTVKIPKTIKCWSGYPASKAGSTHVTPGSYGLWLQQGYPTNEGGYSFVKLSLTITGS